MKSPYSITPSVELLEPRIAPAGLVTFLDVDGDMAFIKTSKGTNESLASAISFVNVLVAKRVLEIDLSKSADEFAGTDLTVGVTKRGLNGDGRVNIGLIDAAASDGVSVMGDGQDLALGKVSVKGDLSQINANSIASLSVYSLGRIGQPAQGANGGNISVVSGSIGSLVATGGIFDVTVQAASIGKFSVADRVENFTLDVAGTLNSATFGLEVAELHLKANNAGTLLFKCGIEGSRADGIISTVEIADKLGSFLSLGSVEDTLVSATALKNLLIKGALIGGVLADARFIKIGAGGLGKGIIGGDLIGSDGYNTGSILVDGTIGNLAIKGSVVGGYSYGTGCVTADGGIGTLTIGGSLLSAPVIKDVTIIRASNIESGKSIGKLTIGGDVRGGLISDPSDNPEKTGVSNMLSIRAAEDIKVLAIGGSFKQFDITSATTNSVGQITAGGSIGKITVGGSISGGGLGGLPVNIMATGGTGPVNGKWVAIQSITVGGSFVNVKIEAGVAFADGVDNVDSSIGSVTVKGSVHDVVVAAGKSLVADKFPSIQARIASIVIGGSVTGSGGFFAQEIGSFNYAGALLKLNPGPNNDNLLPFLYSGARVTETV